MHYIVGDIHSNIVELTKLIRLIKPSNSDKLIFLGDLLDKGPNPSETLAYLSQIKCNKVYLIGNHELVWFQYLFDRQLSRRNFLTEHGGLSTVDRELLKNDDIPSIQKILAKYSSIIREMKQYYIIDDFLIIHGGLSKDQLSEKDLNIGERNYFLRPKDIDMNNKYLDKYRVIAGHTFLKTTPQFHKGYINIDTGAGYGKYLSAYVIEEKKVIRSDGRIFKDKY